MASVPKHMNTSSVLLLKLPVSRLTRSWSATELTYSLGRLLSRLGRWEDKSLETENLAAHLPFRAMMRMIWRGGVGMSRWTRLAVLLAMAMPVSAQMAKGRYLSGMDHVCKAALADGTPYEAWDRVYLTTWEEKPLYVKVRAYYHPGAGEFLWLSTSLSEHGYSEDRKYKSKMAASCEEIHFHILTLQDGEWAGFWGSNGRINVFHCGLKFPERQEAWSHVAAHWQDGSDDARPSAKWVEEISLYKQLGHSFFRPKRWEFDARPYFYNPLVSAKKVGGQWKLEIRGADEPNRATLLLDNNFKLLEVTKNPAVQ